MDTQSGIRQLTRAYGTAAAVLSLYMPSYYMARCETEVSMFSPVSLMINKDGFVSYVVSKSNCDTMDLLQYPLSKTKELTFPVIKKLFVSVRKAGRIKYQPVGDNNGFV